jgi:hypothetical protein
MSLLRRFFTQKVGLVLGSAAVVPPVITAEGVFPFLAGSLDLPTLEPTKVELMILLLLLASVALLCHAVVQLAIILARPDGKSWESFRSYLHKSS